MGRKQADVWENFERTQKQGNSGTWAVCKTCRAGMQGIPERMSKHIDACESECPPKVPKKTNMTMSGFVSSTKLSEKQQIDQAIAEYFYATNSPFQRVEHPSFRKLIKLLRPSYNPPNRKYLSNELNEVHAKCQEKAKKNARKGAGDNEFRWMV